MKMAQNDQKYLLNCKLQIIYRNLTVINCLSTKKNVIIFKKTVQIKFLYTSNQTLYNVNLNQFSNIFQALMDNHGCENMKLKIIKCEKCNRGN